MLQSWIPCPEDLALLILFDASYIFWVVLYGNEIKNILDGELKGRSKSEPGCTLWFTKEKQVFFAS